ncbi:MAG: energy transducer TonB [Muribaculaceae bacterium]|nr:energy transducer TonB [Muribaculaceae bacterium]
MSNSQQNAKTDSESEIRAWHFRLGRHLRHTVLLLIFLLIGIGASEGQTCRISKGINSSGTQCYMEVYEYDFVQEKPSFPGGDSKLVEFINKHRCYPKEAYKKGVEGRVTCSFVVNTNGSVSNIQVIRSVAAPLNEEAIRIFSIMPAWHPGKIDGHCVPVRVVWSVPFRK